MREGGCFGDQSFPSQVRVGRRALWLCPKETLTAENRGHEVLATTDVGGGFDGNLPFMSKPLYQCIILMHIYMEFRKMVMMTLYARQQKRHRCKEQTFGLCGKR